MTIFKVPPILSEFIGLGENEKVPKKRSGLPPLPINNSFANYSLKSSAERSKEVKVKAGTIKESPITVIINKPKNKKWPKKEGAMIDYEKLIDPINSIIRQGYRLFRKDVKAFDYTGYDIGEQEKQICLSPKERLTADGLIHEEKNRKSLMDVLLHIVFLLGVEQGRRCEKQFHIPKDIQEKIIHVYKQSNRDLRCKVDELEAYIDIKEDNPNVSNDNLIQLLKERVKEKQKMRMVAEKLDTENAQLELNKAQVKKKKKEK